MQHALKWVMVVSIAAVWCAVSLGGKPVAGQSDKGAGASPAETAKPGEKAAGKPAKTRDKSEAKSEAKPAATTVAKKAPAKPAAKPKPAKVEFPYPPSLPDGAKSVTVKSNDLLQKPETLAEGVTVAKEAPVVEFMYYPGQDYPGDPWSNWGDSSVANGKYYSAIGDHAAPRGNAFIFEYDPATKVLRKVLDIQATLKMPEGHYIPGKIHSHVEMGVDGWVYCSTHRGSPKATVDANHYLGDWILRANPATGVSEVVAHAVVPKHCLPNGMIDRQRLIFYGGTAPGVGTDPLGIQFVVYDLKNRKLLYSGANGPARAMILSSSTGKVYFAPGNSEGTLMRYDPSTGKPPEELPATIGIRAATDETPQGLVYSVSTGQGATSRLYALDVKTEKVEAHGPMAVGTNQYIASIKADPTGRYLYYVPGAHGGSQRDNSAVVQYDTKTKTRKVIAFLSPALDKPTGAVMQGTYAVAIDERGEKLYITWNVSRGGRVWDTCGLTVIHIPASERPL